MQDKATPYNRRTTFWPCWRSSLCAPRCASPAAAPCPQVHCQQTGTIVEQCQPHRAKQFTTHFGRAAELSARMDCVQEVQPAGCALR